MFEKGCPDSTIASKSWLHHHRKPTKPAYQDWQWIQKTETSSGTLYLVGEPNTMDPSASYAYTKPAEKAEMMHAGIFFWLRENRHRSQECQDMVK